MASGTKEWCNERCYGSFSRTVRLPHEIEEKGADATYADGLLRLILPKKASSVARKLEIH